MKRLIKYNLIHLIPTFRTDKIKGVFILHEQQCKKPVIRRFDGFLSESQKRPNVHFLKKFVSQPM